MQAFAQGEKLSMGGEEKTLREAIRQYSDALTVWQSASQKHEIYETLERIGSIYFRLSEYNDALAYYQKAFALSQRILDMKEEVEVLNNIGYTYVYLGENQKALEYSHRALNYIGKLVNAQDVENQRSRAQALNTLGEVYYSLGDLKKALYYFGQALSIWTAAEDSRGQALAQINLGYMYADSGDLQKAVAHFQQALSLYQAIDDHRGEALTLTAFGNIHSFLGEKQLALNSHDQAMQLFKAIGDRRGEAAALNGIGKVYEDLNDQQTALASYNFALKIYQEIGNRNYEALAYYYLGRVHRSMGEIQQALDYYNQSLSLTRNVGDRRIEAYALNDIGTIYSRSGEKQHALDYYQKGLRLYRQAKDRRGQAYTLNSIGYTYYVFNAPQKAIRYYNQALSLNRVVEDRSGEISTLYNIARAERDLDRISEALSQMEVSNKLIEGLRTKVVSPELRAAYFASVHQHYELRIDLLMQMHERNPTGKFAAAALYASESARARSLLDLLTEAKLDIRQGIELSLLDRERSLQMKMDARAEYQMRLLNTGHNKEEIAEIGQELRELTTQYQELQTEIREQSPRYATLTQPKIHSLEEIQDELKDDKTILLEYALGSERSFLWAVTSTSFDSYEIPKRAVLEGTTNEVYKLLTARQPVKGETLADYQSRVLMADTQYSPQALLLSQMLLGPVVGQLGDKRLIIVADGALQYIPFEALPIAASTRSTREGAANDSAEHNSNSTPLVMEHEIAYLQSASMLAILRKEKSQPVASRKTVAVLADPVFEQDDPRIRVAGKLRATATEGNSDVTDLRQSIRDFGEWESELAVPRLPATLREAEAIKAVTLAKDRMMALSFNASREAAMSTDLCQYQIIHFATHGIINNEHPELSGIILSLVDTQGNRQNGFLRLRDIYNLNLNAELVVLSACRSALGKDINGEGFIGLTRGFMYAGSKSVIASLWKVDDQATAELMEHFYKAMLRDGLSPAAALKSAKKAMLNDSRWNSPYYWAAFVLQGEYKQTITVHNERWKIIYALVILSIVLASLIGGTYAVKRMRKFHLS